MAERINETKFNVFRQHQGYNYQPHGCGVCEYGAPTKQHHKQAEKSLQISDFCTDIH